MLRPESPVYVISKGRFENCMTAKFMIHDGMPFRLVVEPQEADEYTQRFGEDRVLVLPFQDLGQGSIPARNWCWEHSLAAGHARHWIVDDNIRDVLRWHQGRRLVCDSNIAFAAAEDFTSRYENIGMTGFSYVMFGTGNAPPFRLNAHLYSCMLIDNAMPYRWRGRYNEDTDLCLQILSGGLCLVQINAFLIHKKPTMQMKGGNTDQLYKGDGRLKMARSLEQQWPGIVTTERRFSRPQHVIRNAWKSFDTPLIRRADVDFDNLDGSKYEMELVRTREAKPRRAKRTERPE